MENTLSYKGYNGSVEYCAADNILHGNVLYINAIIGYHGESLHELYEDFKIAVDDYLEFCRADGETPETPIKETA